MYDITIEGIEEITKSHYLKLKRIHYTQQGMTKTWDIAQVHDSVAILLYHPRNDSIILVKQFRPAVWLHNQDGFTYELCAGLIDKNLPPEQIAQEEIWEECGYDVPLVSIHKITSFYTSVGFARSRQILYYAEVDDTMKRGSGGGIDIEAIELVELASQDIDDFMFDETKAKTPGLLFALEWFKKRRVQN
ncbi:MAG: NUDIX domain-containing protein [Campylobacterales bacterium]